MAAKLLRLLFVIESAIYLQLLSAARRDLLEATGSAGIQAVIGSSFVQNCANVLVTDDSIFPSSVHKVTRSIRAGQGFGIFQMNNVTWDNNETKEHFVSQIKKLRQTSPCLAVIVVTKDPNLLAEFARKIDDGRLLLWETKFLAITSLELDTLRSIMRNNWALAMANTMVMNCEDSLTSDRCGVFSYLPYSEGSRGRLARVGIWTPLKGLKLISQLPLYPQKYRDFHGASVGLTVWAFMPYFMTVEELDPRGMQSSNYAGRDYIMLDTLRSMLNFTVDFIPTESWEEVIDLVKQRVSFMSPMKLAIMPHLLRELDFTTPIEPATLTFSMAKPVLKPRWQSLYYPLTNYVWVSILVMTILMSVVFVLVYWVGNQGRGQINPGKIIVQVAGTLLGQNFFAHVAPSSSRRLLVGTLLLFSFIIGSAYRGNLTAYLTIRKYPPRIETLQQLLAGNTKVVMPPDAVDFYNGFKQSPSSDFRTLSERVTFVDDFKEGLRLAETSNVAYMYERRFMELMIARHFTPLKASSHLYVARQNVWPGYSAWPIIRDAPFKPVIDRYIQAFNEAGLVEKWGDDVVETSRRISRLKRLQETNMKEEEQPEYSPETEPRDGLNNSPESSQALTLVHMQGPLLLLLFGLVCAALVFAAEMFLDWLIKN